MNPTPTDSGFDLMSTPHNPDSLTPEQYGAADGWRLLDDDEIRHEKRGGLNYAPFSVFSWNRGWEAGICYADSRAVTYRTKLTRAELREGRGIPEQPVSDTPCNHTPLPWNYETDDEGSSMGWIMAGDRAIADIRGDSAQACFDAEFIAVACNGFHELERELAAAQRENTKLRERLDGNKRLYELTLSNEMNWMKKWQEAHDGFMLLSSKHSEMTELFHSALARAEAAERAHDNAELEINALNAAIRDRDSHIQEAEDKAERIMDAAKSVVESRAGARASIDASVVSYAALEMLRAALK